MNDYIVYIIRLENRAFYTGITNNLEKRLSAHKRGKGSKYVRANLPLILVYFEIVNNKSAALKREAQIKKLTHKEKEELIKEGVNHGKISY